MKIIITENKRHRAITKWLDENYGDLNKYSAPGSFRFITYKNNDGGNVFNFNRNTGIVTLVNEGLCQDLKHMFGLNGYELNDILIPWLEERYNLHVERVRCTDFT